MDDRDLLAFYPFVVVRIACRVSARAMGLTDWRGWQPNSGQRSVSATSSNNSYDCLWRAEARGTRGVSACGVYLPDLEHKRPPDLPPGLARLRVVVRND
jgi:hypothetical protein